MKMTARNNAMIVYATLMTVSLAWIGLIFAAPWLMAKRHFLASAFVYRGFSAVCHQMSERSFHFHGFPLGVCSRCTAIYVGFVAGLLLYAFVRDLKEEKFPARWILIAAGVPMLIDFAGGLLGLFENTFLSRSLSGSLFGVVGAFYILPGLVSTINEWRASFANSKKFRRMTIYE
jgi:uncharacterized membrane protein